MMDKADLSKLAQVLGEATKRHFAPLEARIEALERDRMEYRGVWAEGLEYTKNNLVTHAGSTWICVADATREKPPSGTWRLMARLGADGRDAR